VEVVASSNLLLAVRSGTPSNYTYTTQTPTNGSYSLSADQYANLFIRGQNFESGAATFNVRAVHTESWGGSVAKGAASIAAFTLKPIASGLASAPTLKQVTVLEDPSTANAPSLKDFINTAATKLDASETLVYKVTIPTDAKLVALTGSLPTASPGVPAGLSYLIEASDASLLNYKVVPAAQYSGALTLTFQAATQESDGGLAFGTEAQATLTVTPVSDAPLLITPSAVSGLIADANVDSLAIPIQTALVDSSETLSVKVWVKGLTSTSAQTINFKYGSETTPILLKVGVLNNESVYFFEAKTAAELAKLATLNVSATSDFRLDNKLSLLVESSSKDGSAAAATVSKTIDLSIYRPIGAPTLDLNPTGNPGLSSGTTNIGAVEVGTKAAIPFSATLPANLPAGVSYENVSILLTGAPNLGYFAVKTGTGSNASFAPVGASLGEGGVWLFRASDIINSNGTSKPLVLIDAQQSGAVNNLVAQAFIADPTGGTTAASGQDKYNVTFKVGGIDNTDPLILSLSGGAISSSAVNTTANNAISFELESLSAGLERPTYWVTGDAQALSGFAYLVKPGVAANQKIGLSSLYSDFNELAGANRVLAADGVITASELSGVSLWFDQDSDAFIDTGELVSLNALPNFSVTVPEVVARAASSGEITPLYEAKATWTGAPSSGGALFAVAIPYKAATDSVGATPSGNSAYATKPTAKVTVLGDTVSANYTAVPEDLAGGIKFTVDLGKATLLGSGSVTHLVKVYGIPESAKLSAGAKVEAEGSNASFWVLTEEQAANPLAIIGLPTNYLEPIALKAQAVASAVVGTSVQTVIGDAQAVASTATIIGVADTPLLTPNVSGITGAEGGEVFVSANGQAAGDQTLTLTKGTNDSNETLYARVSLDTAATNLEGVRLAAGASGPLTTLANGKYEVLYSDLNRLAFDFKPFFNDPVKLTIEGLSKQGSSYAIASRTAEITIALTPAADTVSGVAALAQSTGSTSAIINEGGAPSLSLVGTPVDAKELVRFEILVGGNSAAANAINALSGTTLQTFDATKAASFGLNSSEVGNWKLFSVLGTKDGATYKVSNATIDLDKYFDGTISYKTRAVAIEPTTGQEGSTSAVIDGTSAGTFTVTPTVADSTYAVQIRDLDGNALRSVTLNEGGASNYFTLAGTTFDPDEAIAVTLANTTYFTVESQLVNNVIQYRLVHNSASGVPTQAADLALTPSVTLTDSGASAIFQATSAPLSVSVNEIASTPVLSSSTPLALRLMMDRLASNLPCLRAPMLVTIPFFIASRVCHHG
jgi:uncharacterized cupredoxin-like copper-binding protein